MNLSSVIFWDVNPSKIDWQKSGRFVISRVVQYGTVADWEKIKGFYGLDRIKREMVEERDLDGRSLSFLSCILGVPKEQFKCFAANQSHPSHFSY